MRRILSVDFDWIMRPCIEAYNGMCGNAHNLNDLVDSWDYILHRLQDMPLHCCEEQFADLALFLKTVTKTLPADHIYFILNHDEVFDVLKKYDCTEEVIIVNVDHHHDFGYPTKDSPEPFSKYLTVANWVHCLHNEKRLAHYTWVGNNNSEGMSMVAEKLQEKFSFYTDLRKIDHLRYDDVIVCFSQEWIPPNVRPMFYVLKELINKEDPE